MTGLKIAGGNNRNATNGGGAGRKFARALFWSAGVLAATAAVFYVRARRDERRHPPSGRFLETDGVLIHYVDQGQGQPVVLLHGNGVMAEDWEISGILGAAAEQRRVIAFDRPGFGYSERPRSTIWTAAAQADLLYKAMKQLGIDRPIVVGHSWGTLVALGLALEHPNDIGGLVLLSGYYFPTMRADVPLSSGPAIPIIGDVMRYTVSPLLGWLLAPKVFRKVFAPMPVSERFAAEFPTGLALRPWQIRASAADTALMIPAATAFSGRYKEITMPVVIMAGDKDEIVDFGRQSEHLHRALPQSELQRIAGAGHMVHYVVPHQVVDATNRLSDHGRRPTDRTSGRPSTMLHSSAVVT
jgi:pimeloyl-ACP methyl ester carboxylesterase